MHRQASKFKLTFLGAAGTVTGSKTLLEIHGYKILVDCGLFQGLKELRNLNWAPFPEDVTKIDTVVLTHAHLDHCGYLPMLVKKGFQGDIHCTEATRDLAEIILLDSAKIMEEDAQRANEHKYTRHKPAKPLYTQKDVKKTMELFVTHNYNEWVILNNDIKFEIINNGHILGSGLVNMHVLDKIVVFSGDMGQKNPMLLYPPKHIKEADVIIMESTYGDRLHKHGDLKKELLNVINETFKKKGILMIPSFAVERTQEILYLLYHLKKDDLLPPMPIYLDSPMGIHATKVYERYQELQNISRFEITHMYDQVKFIDDAVFSKKVCLDSKPKIVLAGSGMIEGGRIIHYLNNHISNPKNTLLFVGYQGEGTRGRTILNGGAEVKFFGKYHPVKCSIKSLPDLSAHGDQNDLIDWLKHLKRAPEHVLLNHGEMHQAEAFCVKIKTEFGWEVSVPKMNQEFVFSGK